MPPAAQLSWLGSGTLFAKGIIEKLQLLPVNGMAQN
jgi:hypothetical protein